MRSSTRSLRREVKLSIRFKAHATLEFDEHFRAAEAASFAECNLFGCGRLLFLTGVYDPHLRFPLFPPSVQLTRESSDENEDERQSDVYEDVVAVHGGTS